MTFTDYYVGPMRVTMGVLASFLVLTSSGLSDATQIVKPAFTIPMDPGYIYRPDGAAFMDTEHLLIVYSRGTFDGIETVTPAGQFYRIYDTVSDTFSPETDMSGTPDAAFLPIAAAGSNGVGRIAFTVPVSGNERSLWLTAVNPDGSLGASVEVHTQTGSGDVAILPDGTTVVVYGTGTFDGSRNGKIYAKLYDADLNQIGSEHQLPSTGFAAIPHVSVGSYINVVFNVLGTTNNPAGSVTVMSLDANFTVRWTKHIMNTISGADTSIATMSNDDSIVAFSAPGVLGDQGADSFSQLVSANGDLDRPYRLPIPRDGEQREPHVTVHQGQYAAVAYGGSRGGSLDTIDFVNLDATNTPQDADPPLVDNARLSTIDAVGVQQVYVAGGPGGQIAVLYNSQALNPHVLDIGSQAKIVLLQAGPPPCPADVNCDTLIPFHTTGLAAHRMNEVIRPSMYGDLTADGRIAFLRQLREHIIGELYYGSRQHQTRFNRFNFLVDLVDADILTGPGAYTGFGACPDPIALDVVRYETQFPWVRAVGAQLNPAVYFDSASSSQNPPTIACANIDDLSNGAGSYYYFGYEVVGMEHEFSHANYVVPDEYEGGGFMYNTYNPPFQSQYSSLALCQNDAIASGWDANDCYVACKGVDLILSSDEEIRKVA